MGENIKAIRARIKSVDSTRHITKAMELVASSKIKKAGARMEQSRFYRTVLLQAFAGLSSEKSIYSASRSRDLPVLYIVVAGDRGLAGGYNNNIFRSLLTLLRPEDLVLPVGKRAVEWSKTHANTVSEEFMSVETFTGADSAKAAKIAVGLWNEGKIGECALVSTWFVSMLSQRPALTFLLPLETAKRELDKRRGKDKNNEPEESGSRALTEYEPSAEEVLAALIPEYISGVLYSSVCESYASELAARRSAMDTATKNADEMLDNLTLTYNRARQGAITQEITEITAGANA